MGLKFFPSCALSRGNVGIFVTEILGRSSYVHFIQVVVMQIGGFYTVHKIVIQSITKMSEFGMCMGMCSLIFFLCELALNDALKEEVQRLKMMAGHQQLYQSMQRINNTDTTARFQHSTTPLNE